MKQYNDTLLKIRITFAVFLTFCFLVTSNVNANIMCNDGTESPSCTSCHRGCCSYHGGCASYYSDDYYISNEDTSATDTSDLEDDIDYLERKNDELDSKNDELIEENEKLEEEMEKLNSEIKKSKNTSTYKILFLISSSIAVIYITKYYLNKN